MAYPSGMGCPKISIPRPASDPLVEWKGDKSRLPRRSRCSTSSGRMFIRAMREGMGEGGLGPSEMRSERGRLGGDGGRAGPMGSGGGVSGGGGGVRARVGTKGEEKGELIVEGVGEDMVMERMVMEGWGGVGGC